MKTKSRQTLSLYWLIMLASTFLMFVLLGCKDSTQTKTINVAQQDDSSETITGEEVIWHVKALHPDGKLLDVKAFDKDGTIYDIKAIQDTDQTMLMDVKALINNKKVSVKVLVSEDRYLPVKAIRDDGTILDIKAITEDGDKLDVKGVSQSGNIIHLKAINKNGSFCTIEAISPKGWINDVKGVKMFKEPVEAVINGVEIYAHIKALTQNY